MTIIFLKTYLFNLINNLKNIIITKYALAKKDLSFLSLKSVLFFFTFISYIYMFFILKIEIESKNTLIQFFSFPWFFVNLEKENRLQYFCKILASIFDNNHELFGNFHPQTIKFFEELTDKQDNDKNTSMIKLCYYLFLSFFIRVWSLWSFKLFIKILEIICYNCEKSEKNKQPFFIFLKLFLLSFWKQIKMFWQNFFIFLSNFFYFFQLCYKTGIKNAIKELIKIIIIDFIQNASILESQYSTCYLSLCIRYKYLDLDSSEEDWIFIKENDILFFFFLHILLCFFISFVSFFLRYFLVIIIFKFFLPFLIFFFASLSIGDFGNLIWFPSGILPTESLISKSIYDLSIRSGHSLLHTSTFPLINLKNFHNQFLWHPTIYSNYPTWLFYKNTSETRLIDFILWSKNKNHSVFNNQLQTTYNTTHARTTKNIENIYLMEDIETKKSIYLYPVPTICHSSHLQLADNTQDKIRNNTENLMTVCSKLFKTTTLLKNPQYLQNLNFVLFDNNNATIKDLNILLKEIKKMHKKLPIDFFLWNKNNNNFEINENKYIIDFSTGRIFCKQTNQFIYAFSGYTLKTPDILIEQKLMKNAIEEYGINAVWLPQYHLYFEDFRLKFLPRFNLRTSSQDENDFIFLLYNTYNDFYLKHLQLTTNLTEKNLIKINTDINNARIIWQTNTNLNFEKNSLALKNKTTSLYTTIYNNTEENSNDDSPPIV